MADLDPHKSTQDESGEQDERYLNIAEMMIGTTMMFVGFLNIFLSISGGFEMGGAMPMILYFAGVAVWAHAVIKAPTLRYVVMGVGIVMALAFFHYGEVLFWHKITVFWATVLIVVFFMFRSPAKS
ncbi:MAG TPA: hypothetical protein VFA38_06940 [Nitrospirales bacterium]|nr:hypothetical protein [Nitrospirales bacterium]